MSIFMLPSEDSTHDAANFLAHNLDNDVEIGGWVRSCGELIQTLGEAFHKETVAWAERNTGQKSDEELSEEVRLSTFFTNIADKVGDGYEVEAKKDGDAENDAKALKTAETHMKEWVVSKDLLSAFTHLCHESIFGCDTRADMDKLLFELNRACATDLVLLISLQPTEKEVQESTGAFYAYGHEPVEFTEEPEELQPSSAGMSGSATSSAGLWPPKKD